MDSLLNAFEPPAPTPRNRPPHWWEVIHVAIKNPLELWGEPAYQWPVLQARFFGETFTIANHPDLVRRVLVEEASNYLMQPVRQAILKPILREGLLTAEGEIWKRSRKAMAPVFTPRHARGFADQMLEQSELFADGLRKDAENGAVINVSAAMTGITFEILSATLFSGDIANVTPNFGEDVEALLKSMGRVDPMDLIQAPGWVPRFIRMRGEKTLQNFRNMVAETMALRRQKMKTHPDQVPDDFLTLLLRLEGESGLSDAEIEDNLLTFIGAGHETTARALGWTLYCLANTPHWLALMEAEIDEVCGECANPLEWLERMPHVRAAFEEAMRLYPPAPNIARAPIKDDHWRDENGREYILPAGEPVSVLPWVLHRHELYWDQPRRFVPERFMPENREKIGRFQYLPFGAGPRICIGATFALQEAVIVLAVLLKQFRFEMTEETNPWPVQRLTVQPLQGMPMRIRSR